MDPTTPLAPLILSGPQTALVLAIVISWELGWTCAACWAAARKNDFRWFLAFFLLTFAGIPEMIYLWQQKKLGTTKD